MAQQPQSVLVTTTERPAGYEVKQALGQVFGVVVRSRGLGGNMMANLRALGGGEIVECTRLVADTVAFDHGNQSLFVTDPDGYVVEFGEWLWTGPANRSGDRQTGGCEGAGALPHSPRLTTTGAR